MEIFNFCKEIQNEIRDWHTYERNGIGVAIHKILYDDNEWKTKKD